MKIYLNCQWEIYFSILFLLIIFGCSKKSNNCPLQQYTEECTEKGNSVFGDPFSVPYNRVVIYTFEEHCREYALTFVENESYDLGSSSKHCVLK